jgi:hypothetical protein
VHGAGRHRARAAGQRVRAHPDADVVVLLAVGRAQARHLVLGQASHPVLGEHLPELPGLAQVPVGEGERDEVLVAPVDGEVLAVLVQEHQPHVDRLEDRVREGPGVAELLQGRGELTRPAFGLRLAVPCGGEQRPDDSAGQRGDEGVEDRAGQRLAVETEVEDTGDPEQADAGNGHDDRAAVAELPDQPDRRDDGQDPGAARLRVEPQHPERDQVEDRDDGDRPPGEPRPGCHRGQDLRDQDDDQAGQRPRLRGQVVADAGGSAAPQGQVHEHQEQEQRLRDPRLGRLAADQTTSPGPDAVQQGCSHHPSWTAPRRPCSTSTESHGVRVRDGVLT